MVAANEVVNSPLTNILTKEDIIALGDEVRMVDAESSTNLELFCYNHCSATDSLELKSCRGVVFDGEKLVLQAFPYTTELTSIDHKEISEIPLDQVRIFTSHEGTLLRVFYYNDKWVISTHRKLDAFRSKWASRESFGETFVKSLNTLYTVNNRFGDLINNASAENPNILDKFLSTLDKNNKYMFLVRPNTENRIVCNAPEVDMLFHVGTFKGNVLDLDVDCGVPHSPEHKFASHDQLFDYLANVNIKDTQGLICFSRDNTQTKLVSKKYSDLFNARGNEPSLKFRYLQVRGNRQTVDELMYLYPRMETTFIRIENSIYEIAKNIYTSYVSRFIKKHFVTVPVEEFAVIRECHSWHNEDRSMNRISIEKVLEVLNKQNPTKINKMLRRYRNERETLKSIQVNNEVRDRSHTLTLGE